MSRKELEESCGAGIPVDAASRLEKIKREV